MFFKLIKYVSIVLGVSLTLVSCEDDLNLTPEDERITSERVFINLDGYQSGVAKLYAGISLSGQRGPSGLPDLQGLDEGFSNYLRLYWKMQELTTDEAVIAWNDGTLRDLHSQNWTAGNEFIRTMYDRIFFQIASINAFLREADPGVVSGKGISGADAETIAEFRAEARFLRALSYWHALDLYGTPTFVTENDPTAGFLPPQTNQADLFAYIESELLDIEDDIAGARSNEYGRADRGAVWMLLAKLYLNAEVYGAGNRYNDCITYCNNIINAGYSIPAVPYSYLFIADNDTNGAEEEVIFTIPFDGINTQSFGGTTFIVHAAVGGNMNPRADFGINGGWFGLRTTSALINQFGTPVNQEEVFQRDDTGNIVLGEDGNPISLGFQEIWNDKRLSAHTPGQNLEIENIGAFNDGYAISKYTNISSTGQVGSDPDNHPDTDFPMFRLADVYLMYAEATLKGTSGDIGTAVGYINQLRERAHEGSSSFNIAASDLTEDFVLDERARELYWEAHRRTDLIRNRQFTENGIWPFKGGENIPEGQTTDTFRNLMPIPATQLALNPNLRQNSDEY